jgi:hypothetical protein
MERDGARAKKAASISRRAANRINIKGNPVTINQLNKLTSKLIEQGHGRRAVCVDKSKVTHPLEPDGCCVIPVTAAEIDVHEMMNDDGGVKELANGQTAYRTALVIKAEC